MGRRVPLVLVSALGFLAGALPAATVSVAPTVLTFPLAGSFASQTITVTSNPPNESYRVSASITTAGGIRWLSVSPSGDTTSGTLTVSVNAALLPPGAYLGKITLSSNGVTVATVPVSLAVSDSANRISITPFPAGGPAGFTAAAGGANPAPIAFTVTSPAPVQFTTSTTDPWLSVSVAPGFNNVTPSQIVLTPNIAGLAGSPGAGSIYSGSVRVVPDFFSGYSAATLTTFLRLSGAPAVVNGQYSWSSFDVPGASSTNPIGINDFGMVSGYYTAAGRTHGFFRDVSGAITTIDYPGAANTFVEGLNSFGQVTGFYTDGTGSHGFTANTDGSNPIAFDYPGSEGFTWSYGIDSSGNISGVTNTTAFYRPADGFSFSPYTVEGGSIGFLPNAAFGINDFGQIVGTCCANGNTGYLSNPDLSSVTFQLNSTFAANAINNAGNIAGYLSDTRPHGFIRTPDGGTYVLLDAPGADSVTGTRAYGLNTDGNVTGWYGDPSGGIHGFIATPTAPLLAVSPSVVSITGHATGPAVSQNITISSTGPVFFSIDTASLPPWLSVTPPVGAAPFFLQVTVDPKNLDIGSYSATVTVNSATPGAAPTSFVVNANILSPLPPKISLSPAAFFLSYTAGGKDVPAAQKLVVGADSQAALNSTSIVYGQGAQGWLTVQPESGKLPQDLPLNLLLSVSPVLPAGKYSALIRVDAGTVDPASTLDAAVFLTVNAPSTGAPPPPSISYSPAVLSFSYQAGGSPPPAQTLSAASTAGAHIAASAVTTGGGNWLLVSPDTADNPASFSVSANGAGLNAGNYSGTVILTSGIATSQVNVSLTVAPAPLTIAPKSLTFVSPSNYGLGAGQTIQVNSTIAASFNVLVDDGGGHWLQADSVSAKAPSAITIRANTASLGPGTYQGTVTLAEGPVTAAVIPVTLNVGPPALLQLAPGSLTFNYQTGDAAPAAQTIRVSAVSGSSGQNFSVAASSPGSWLSVDSTAGTTPSRITAVVNPAGLAAGSYTGAITLTPSDAGSSPQIVSVTLKVSGSAIPVLSALANAASSVSGAVAPGEMLIVSGSGLGPKNAVTYSGSSGTNLPLTLSGTAVSFDGIPAPLLYVSDTIVIAQAPYGIARGMTSVSVRYQGINSAPKTFSTAPAAPGLYTATAEGDGAAAALNQDLTFNSPSNAAARGSIIVLYATGEGQTSPRSIEGRPNSLTPPFASPVLPVTITIGDKPAQIAFVSETPGTNSGCLQINAIVPLDAAVGDAVPVRIAVGGVSGQTGVTVSIR